MKFKQYFEATESFVQKIVDPALLTLSEFIDKIGARVKHNNEAYNWSIKDMRGTKDKYPTILFRKTIHNIPFEFRLNKENRFKTYRFVKTDSEGKPIEINGETQYYTEQELEQLKYKKWEYSFSIFHDNQQVAVTQDEWGCMLVVVAQEYRGFGLGPILTKLAYEAEPGKHSGGCTPMGQKLVASIHKNFVREYLQKGFYSYLVKQGTLTMERVKEILNSAQLKDEKKLRPQNNYNFKNPEDWVMMHEEGFFIIYDKKIKDIMNDEDKGFWAEKAIIGVADIGPTSHTDKYRLRTFGGETEGIKKFLMLLALSWAAEEDNPLFVHNEDLPFVDTNKAEIFDKNWVKLKIAPINYKGMEIAERQFRKSFDKYNEFKVRVMEMAVSKYD